LSAREPRRPGGEGPAGRPLGSRDRLAVALVVAVAALLLLSSLGKESLLGDEALYASVARDSLRAGALFPLVVDGSVYHGKPPLGIWAIAASFRLFGVGELPARLPAALAALAALALLAAALARRHGALVALFAPLLLVTGHQLLFRHGLRSAVFEAPLLLALTGFVLEITDVASTRRARCVGAALWLALGTAVKGLAAPAFALAFLPAWALARWRRLDRDELAAAGAALLSSLAVWALWLGALWIAGVDALRDATVRDVGERFLAGVDPEHLQGPGFYLTVLRREYGALLLLAPLALLPLVPPRAEGTHSPSRPWALAAAWALGPLALYSLSASKLSWYLYPALPGFALLIALGAQALSVRARRGHALLGALVVVLLAAAVAQRAVARWRRIDGPRPEQVTLRAVVEAARLHPGARIVLDVPDDGGAPLREWHTFYLGQAPSPSPSLDDRLAAGECPLVVTSDPARPRARPALAEAPVVPLHRVTARERPLYLVDGCGGAIADLAARSLPRGAPFDRYTGSD